MPGTEAQRPYLLIMRNSGCRKWLTDSLSTLDALTVVGERRLSLIPEQWKPMTTLCLFRYNHRAAQGQVEAALHTAPSVAH